MDECKHEMRSWRGGHHPGLVLRVLEDDNRRVGDCWMRGRLKHNDVIMCLEHAGDCFYNYVLVRPNKNPNESIVNVDGKQVYQLIEGSRFGAYELGLPHTWQPTAREFHLLMAGEMVGGERAD